MIGLSDQFVGEMGKHIIMNVFWKKQELVDGIIINVENVLIAMMEGGIPEDVFQNVVVHVAARIEILEVAVVDVKILKLHMSYEWTNDTPIDVK